MIPPHPTPPQLYSWRLRTVPIPCSVVLFPALSCVLSVLSCPALPFLPCCGIFLLWLTPTSLALLICPVLPFLVLLCSFLIGFPLVRYIMTSDYSGVWARCSTIFWVQLLLSECLGPNPWNMIPFLFRRDTKMIKYVLWVDYSRAMKLIYLFQIKGNVHKMMSHGNFILLPTQSSLLYELQQSQRF